MSNIVERFDFLDDFAYIHYHTNLKAMESNDSSIYPKKFPVPPDPLSEEKLQLIQI